MKQKSEFDEINKFSGINKHIKSKALQFIINRISDGTFKDFIDDWKWIFTYSVKYKKIIILYTLLGILSTTLSLVSSVVSKYLIDIITGYQTSKLLILAVAMVLSTVISIIFSSVVKRVSAKMNIYVNNDIQSDIFDKILDADWAELNKYSNGELLNRFNNDVVTIADNSVNWLPTLIIDLYNFISTFCVVLYYDVTMAFIALISAPFLLLISRYILKKVRAHRQKMLDMNGKLMAFEVETFYNMDTIKSFGISDSYSGDLKRKQNDYKQCALDYNSFSIKTNILLSVLSASVSFLAFGYCLFRLWSGNITYGTMTLFLTQRSKLSSCFSSIIDIVPGMLNSAVSAHRIRELVQLPREHHDYDSADRLLNSTTDGITIHMQELSFSYENGKKVIDTSEFIAYPNEITALIGSSGEGKTTMIRLMLGLIYPSEGHVVLKTDSESFDTNADTRCLFSYVPQGNTILSGTIAENLRKVKPDASDDELISALKISCAWEFVTKMPDGINSEIGENGHGISEGQAQRISIARAVLRDAPILLLDEATSSLDMETEKSVLKNIMEYCPKKTCIVTTHRPSVLSMCNQIYRVSESKILHMENSEALKLAKDF